MPDDALDLRDPPTGEALPEPLVRALQYRSPDALAVLADWLLDRGDPWGTVLARALAGTDEDGVVAGIRLLSAAWFGDPQVSDRWNDQRHRRRTWRPGESGIRVHWEDGRPVDVAADTWDGRAHTRLADFLHTPAGLLLDALELYGEGTGAILERLCARGPLRGLRRLSVQNGQVDLPRFAPALPGLRELSVTEATLVLGAPDLESLERVRLAPRSPGSDTFAELRRARLPSLRSFHLENGGPQALGPALAMVFRRAPHLEEVGLRDVNARGLVASWLVAAPMSLRRFTLRGGALDPDDAAALEGLARDRPEITVDIR